MSLRQDCIDLVADFIGGEFAEFAQPATITMAGAFDYDTQQTVGDSSFTMPMIRLEFDEFQVGQGAAMSGDYMLIGQYQLAEFIPRPDNCTVEYDGQKLAIIRVVPYDVAAIELHVRRL